MKKRIIFVLLIVLIILSNSSLILAVNTSQFKPLKPYGYSEFTKVGGNIISVIEYVGIIAGAIVLTIIGIKYMLGSVEEKAEYKKTMIPYIVGCAFIMCSSIFVGVIDNAITGKSSGYNVKNEGEDPFSPGLYFSTYEWDCPNPNCNERNVQEIMLTEVNGVDLFRCEECGTLVKYIENLESGPRVELYEGSL